MQHRLHGESVISAIAMDCAIPTSLLCLMCAVDATHADPDTMCWFQTLVINRSSLPPLPSASASRTARPITDLCHRQERRAARARLATTLVTAATEQAPTVALHAALATLLLLESARPTALLDTSRMMMTAPAPRHLMAMPLTAPHQMPHPARCAQLVTCAFCG